MSSNSAPSVPQEENAPDDHEGMGGCIVCLLCGFIIIFLFSIFSGIVFLVKYRHACGPVEDQLFLYGVSFYIWPSVFSFCIALYRRATVDPRKLQYEEERRAGNVS